MAIFELSLLVGIDTKFVITASLNKIYLDVGALGPDLQKEQIVGPQDKHVAKKQKRSKKMFMAERPILERRIRR